MKTKEELNALKEEVETVSRKLHELTDEELAQVTGGQDHPKYIIYTVKGRENLSTIAREHGTTVKILMELNNIADPMTIYVYAGQQLLIPLPQ